MPIRVEAFLLRCEGVKLTSEVIATVGPVRGRLRIYRYRSTSVYDEDDGMRTTATIRSVLHGGALGGILLRLENARVTRETKAGILVTGLEVCGVPGSQCSWPQAWWCRFVDGPRVAASAPAGPVDLVAA